MSTLQTNAPPSFGTEDFETRGAETDHQDLRLWLRMMTLHKLISNEIRRRFRSSFGMSLSHFDLMSQIFSTRTGIRMGELSNRLMVTTGNITGLTDDLEADGLVERMVDPRNRRAFLVRLTPNGRKQFRAAAKVHENWIAEFFSSLSPNDKKILFEILGVQKASVLSRIQHTTKLGKKGADG